MISGKEYTSRLESFHMGVAQATGSPTQAPRDIQSADSPGKPAGGFLIVNADDWGRDPVTTDRILECSERGAVSSVSAMVFMEDSERAAALARQKDIEAGLHLNFTTQFSAPNCPTRLQQRQQQLGRYLLRHRFAQVVFHPGLMQSFEYVVAAQIDEYRRIYGTEPARLDGHHHMHLCANVVLQRLMPPGTIVRRNFSFERGEKGLANRLYRKALDRALSRRHLLADFFISLAPLEPADRLERIYSLARQFVVELETHPVQPEEYRYLVSEEMLRQIGDTRIAPPSELARSSRLAEETRS
jgi:chitin disaccharide deacetylase